MVNVLIANQSVVWSKKTLTVINNPKILFDQITSWYLIFLKKKQTNKSTIVLQKINHDC